MLEAFNNVIAGIRAKISADYADYADYFGLDQLLRDALYVKLTCFMTRTKLIVQSLLPFNLRNLRNLRITCS